MRAAEKFLKNEEKRTLSDENGHCFAQRHEGHKEVSGLSNSFVNLVPLCEKNDGKKNILLVNPLFVVF
jgi:hypothetical protein